VRRPPAGMMATTGGGRRPSRHLPERGGSAASWTGPVRPSQSPILCGTPRPPPRRARLDSVGRLDGGPGPSARRDRRWWSSAPPGRPVTARSCPPYWASCGPHGSARDICGPARTRCWETRRTRRGVRVRPDVSPVITATLPSSFPITALVLIRFAPLGSGCAAARLPPQHRRVPALVPRRRRLSRVPD